MVNVVSDGLFLPALILALLAFAVPRLLAMVLPEGVPALMVNAVLSTLAMFTISAVFFFFLYMWQGAPMAELLASGLAENVLFFGRLGLASGIIWAPIMLLSIAGLPRKWVHKTW